MFAGRQTSHVGHDLHRVAFFGESDRAFHIVSFGRMEDTDGFARFLGESRGVDKCESPGRNETESSSVKCVFLPSCAGDRRDRCEQRDESRRAGSVK